MQQQTQVPIIKKGDRKTLLASTLGYAMDGLDIMILAFAMILIKAEFGLTDAEGGMIQTITLIGTVIGGIFFGMLADKFGRVRVFNWTILLFSIFTGLAAISTSAEMFTIFRFIAGLGLGGEFGIGMTLVAETWPAHKRSRATAVVAIGFQVGIVLAALVSLLSPYIGWHGMFLIGALPHF
ncbi:MFS transporter [Ignatzschineria indica]|uniref:MFS transporter n=1 Tax=Ignatzschineria indica TaxID=472583 RepID=UPI0036382611